MAENKAPNNGRARKINITQGGASNKSAVKKEASGQGTRRANGKSSGAFDKKTVKRSQDKPSSEKIIHKFIPFFLFVVALLMLCCLIFGDVIGVVGDGIKKISGGVFGMAAYLFVVVLVYLGIVWRKLIDSRKYKLKLIMLSLTILTVSALCEVISLAIGVVDGANAFPGVDVMFEEGGRMLGGGFLGGLMGWGLYAGLNLVSLVVLIPALIVFLLVIFDLTPADIAERVRLRRAKRLEAKAAEEEAARLLSQKNQREHQNKPETENAYSDMSEIDANIANEAQDDGTELFDDGMYDTMPKDDQKPEKGAVIVDGEVQELDEDKEESHESGNGEFRLADVFDDRRRRQLQANDDDDSAEMSDTAAEEDGDIVFEEVEDREPETVKPEWIAPPVDLLVEDKTSKADLSDSIAITKRKLLETLSSFDIRVKDIGYSIGPTITRYEIYPDSGVRVRAIANLVDDIALNLAAGDIRIEAPIPNKPAVGVEVPNAVRATVRLRSIIDTDTFRNSSPLTVCLGQDVGGKNIFFDIKKMPHMIIAGTTGSGKSVCINGIVCSLLYKNPPDKVKLIMIDPKKVEFSIYQHIPHLYCPIISDSRKAAGALASAVAEMERRYSLVEDVGVRDIDSYNKATERDPDREYLPKLIIVIDELADLMMMAKADVEQFITRIAQKARAVGIHLIIGTQRPSVDVITGLIKANVPSRIACTVKSQVDSRTILDIGGAEKLIGQGDMLFSPIGLAKPMRVQGAFLEDAEVARVIDFIKANNAPVEYNSAFMDSMEAAAMNVGEKKTGGAALDAADMSDENGDTKFRQAVEIAISEGKISTSLLQRKLEIGYGRAAKLIDRMEELGYVSAPDGNKPRRILISKQEYAERSMNDTLSE